jgi:hypothetical protein
MGIHKLTEQKARLIDKILRFMLETDIKRGQHEVFTYDAFHLDKYANNEQAISEDTIKAAFNIANNYLTDTPKPYDGSWGNLYTNGYTEIFLNEGGFLSIWEDDNIKERQINQQRESTIWTNRCMVFLTAALVICSIIPILQKCSTDTNKYNQWQLEQQQLQKCSLQCKKYKDSSSINLVMEQNKDSVKIFLPDTAKTKHK